jgi:uncharacterized protein DUF4136
MEVPMTTMYRLMIGLAIAALLPAVAVAQKVRYDFAPGTDFSSFKTYALSESGSSEMETVSEKTTLYDSPFIKQRTNEAIEAQLQGLGMTRDDTNPDVVVSARRSFKTEYATYGYYPMWGWGYPYHLGSYGVGYGGGAGFTEEITVGTLIIDLKNAANGQLLWRGSGEKSVLNTSKPEKRIKRVNKEVAKIFRHFPPDGIVTDDDDDDDDHDDDDER